LLLTSSTGSIAQVRLYAIACSAEVCLTFGKPAQVPLGMAVGTYVAALLAQVPVAVVVSANVGWCFGCYITRMTILGFRDHG